MIEPTPAQIAAVPSAIGARVVGTSEPSAHSGGLPSVCAPWYVVPGYIGPFDTLAEARDALHREIARRILNATGAALPPSPPPLKIGVAP